MRRAAARLLALATFGLEARRWRGYAARTAGAGAPTGAWALVPPGGAAVLLPAPFVDAFSFPFRVSPVPVVAEAPAGPSGWQAQQPQAQAGPAPARPTTAAAGSRRLAQQQRLLRPAAGDAAAARRLLDGPPPSGADAPPALVHATAATLAALDAPSLAASALAAAAGARSHAEAARALRGLGRLAAAGPGLGALLAAPWGGALGRLLGASPVTGDDQELWLELLPLIERLLLGGRWREVRAGGAARRGAASAPRRPAYSLAPAVAWPEAFLCSPACASQPDLPPAHTPPPIPRPLQAQYMELALALHASALPWLRARGACDDAGRPPLADPDAAVGAGAVGAVGALAPDAAKRLRLAVSRRALRLLLQLLRCASGGRAGVPGMGPQVDGGSSCAA
jgi:hypothetical protein